MLELLKIMRKILILLGFLLFAGFAGPSFVPFDVLVNGKSIYDLPREVEIKENVLNIKFIVKRPINITWYRVKIEPKKYEELAGIFGIPLEGEPNMVLYPQEVEQNIGLPEHFCGKIKVSADVKVFDFRTNHTTQYGIVREFNKECDLIGAIISVVVQLIPPSLIKGLLGI